MDGLATVKEVTDGIPTPGEKRGRGRPKGTTKSGSSAPKSGSSKPKQGGGDVLQTKIMVQTLLTVVFNITAMRAGEHWKLSSEEASNLAEPIAAILDRHDMTEKAGAYGDYIALVAAVGMIIVPKVMISMEVSKRKKGVQGVVRHIQPKQQAGSAGTGTDPNPSPDDGGSREVQSGNTAYRPSDVKRHLAGIIG